MSNQKLIPAFATHPGELIKDELEARKLSQKELCETSGISRSVLSELIHGKRSMSKNVAKALEQVLNIPAIFWLNLQNQYDIDCVAINARNERTTDFLTSTRIQLEALLKDSALLSNADREELQKIEQIISLQLER
jgi:addiction module antidote protein HigA